MDQEPVLCALRQLISLRRLNLTALLNQIFSPVPRLTLPTLVIIQGVNEHFSIPVGLGNKNTA